MPAAKVRVRLLSPKPETMAAQAKSLVAAGFQVNADPRPVSKFISHLRDGKPDAALFDLDHAPSFSRQIATVIRTTATLQHIALVFAGGEAGKIAALKTEFPDATFTSWEKSPEAIRKAIRNQPASPAKPKPYMERWVNRTALQKLGIKEGMTVALLGAPEGFEESLGDLPEAVRFEPRLKASAQLAIWFVRSQDELERETPFLAARLPEKVSIWLVYPKQTSRIKSGVTQNTVRAAGLANGLVDYKICAVDADWTGLKFARKKS